MTYPYGGFLILLTTHVGKVPICIAGQFIRIYIILYVPNKK